MVHGTSQPRAVGARAMPDRNSLFFVSPPHGQHTPARRDTTPSFGCMASVSPSAGRVTAKTGACVWPRAPQRKTAPRTCTPPSVLPPPSPPPPPCAPPPSASLQEIQTQVLVINSQNDIAHRRSTEVLTQLYEVLIRPIAVHLPDHPQDPIVIIPQGPLCYLPWPAFWNRSDSQFLIEQHALTLTSSAAVMLHNQRRRDEMRTARGGIRRAPSMRSQVPGAGGAVVVRNGRRKRGGGGPDLATNEGAEVQRSSTADTAIPPSPNSYSYPRLIQPLWHPPRLAAGVCQLRHDQMEQGPTEPHAGRSTFLLSSGAAGGGCS